MFFSPNKMQLLPYFMYSADIFEKGYIVLKGAEKRLQENKNVKEFYLDLIPEVKNHRSTQCYHRREPKL
jgi:hypothetical protein